MALKNSHNKNLINIPDKNEKIFFFVDLKQTTPWITSVA